MAETHESLQQMLDSIAESCRTYGMEMNANRQKSFEMWCYRGVLRISWKEHKTNKEVPQAADVTERTSDNEEIALRWSCYKGALGTSCAASLEEVEDALKGAQLTTSSNGPAIVHMEKSNGKLRVARNGESRLPTFGPKNRIE
ncbi:hypothetical protein ElyMa_006226400 [Elysia marginata]|uniref:Uncharacterized protein n=1 Tax=Elysia marginata TaxID=1093978 RepID=A0AAV4H6W0_9GAST|nr:hypothetical protein ElyMa_006226400 [Elysia marginata]